eukprot:gene23177-31497_t
MTPFSNTFAALLLCVHLFIGSGDEYQNGKWRKTLDEPGSCWTMPSEGECIRKMVTAHGGEWNATFPYDSLPAFMTAYDDGADAVKGDFRVSKDNIGVVMHSSPVEWFESPNCKGKYVEKMTAEECQQCKMAISDYNFTTVPKFLAWAEDKVNVMLCVKVSSDIPRAISTLVENNATHRAYLEIHINDLLNLEVTAVPDWQNVYYTVHVSNAADISTMIDASPLVRSRAFLLEFDGWDSWSGVEEQIARAKSYGFRTFAKSNDDSVTATVQNHLNLYHTGFDVAYSYNLPNAVEARMEVNKENNISPP